MREPIFVDLNDRMINPESWRWSGTTPPAGARPSATFSGRYRQAGEEDTNSERLGVKVRCGCIWSDELRTSDLWYRFLNLGIPIVPSGGTDAFPPLSAAFIRVLHPLSARTVRSWA
jgi:hypothetical protein